MATLGVLQVALKASTSRFEKKMKGARRTVERFGRQAAAVGRKVALMGTALTAVAAGALTVLTKRSMSAIDATAKLADRIGTTTEALTGLRHAAKITGAGAETLDKGLQFLAKSLGEATRGTGEAKDALEMLGVGVEALIGRDPAEQFRMIAEATADLATQEQKAYVASKLFGRAGVALVNTLALGSDGLREMQEEADRLGISYSRLDAAKVEQANDALTRLGEVTEGIGNTIAIAVAPYVEALADEIEEWGTSGESAGERVLGVLEDISLAIVDVIQWLDEMTAKAKASWAGAKGAYGWIIEKVGQGLGATGDVAAALSGGGIEGNHGGRGVGSDFGARVSRAAAQAARLTGQAIQKSAFGGAQEAYSDYLDAKMAKQRILVKFAEFRWKAEERAAKSVKSQSRYLDRILATQDTSWTITSALADMTKGMADDTERRAEAEASVNDWLTDSLDKIGQEFEDRDRNRRSLERELQLLRAATDHDRQRVEILNELDDRLREYADDEQAQQTAKLIASEKLADLNEDMSQAAQIRAAADTKSAEEQQKITAAIQKQADITKRFAALPGTGGLFGFGAGRVGGFTQFYQPGRRRRARATAPGAASSAGGGAVAAAAQAASAAAGAMGPATDAVTAMAGAVKELADSQTHYADEVHDGVKGARAATVGAISSLKADVVQLRAEFRSWREEARKAARTGIGSAGG